MTTKFLKYALRYAALGMAVFPCQVQGKAPITPNGFYDATTDPATINEWWGKRWPNANIGWAIPEDRVVVDLDTEQALLALATHEYSLPATASQTTSRGRHFVYAHSVPNASPRKLPGIEGVDIKTKGGYIILAPSVHPSGKVYEWREHCPPNVVTDSPEWLTRHLQGSLEASPSQLVATVPQVDVSRILNGLAEPGRAVELFRYACRLRRQGLGLEEARILLTQAAGRCQPPLSHKEMTHALDSAWRYEPGHERAVRDAGEVLSIRELQGRVFPPVSWCVPGLIPEGLVVLAAAPKAGKSFYALQLALATGTGGSFLRKYRAGYGEALYLDLEQPPRRTQGRMRGMAGWEGAQDSVFFVHHWPKHDQGGFDKLDAYLDARPDTRLVIVDVLAKVIGAKPTGNVYDSEYRIFSELKEVTDKHGITTIAIHHDNKSLDTGDKFDRISGSRALLAVADAAMVLTRKRGEQAGELFVAGREVEDQTIDLWFDSQQKSWKAVDSPASNSRRDAANIARIFDAVNEEIEDEISRAA